jgi:CubicO group peptidase (beta-lactamase class C family)
MKLSAYCKALVVTLSMLLPALINAQIILTNAKQNAAIDYSRLATIDTIINNYISKNWLTGAVTLVLKDNQLVQYKGYGYADVETKKPMQKDAIFRIMSQTKAITSVGIMILYESGENFAGRPHCPTYSRVLKTGRFR